MVIVKITNPKTEKTHEFYFDKKLYENLIKKVKKSVQKKDKDRVIIVDGGEGNGKSTFAFQIAKILYPSFDLNNICFTSEEFVRAISQASKNECIVYDEAFTGLSSRGALSEVNRMLVSLMMEMRQKNLYVIIVLPTFFLLDKYVAIWRARDLFHIYERNGERGFWVYYNRNKKKLLYLKGKKEYIYSGVRSNFRGRFIKGYIVDEDEYRKKKSIALKSRDRRTKSDKFKEQRNNLIRLLYKELDLTLKTLSEKLKEYRVSLKSTQLSDILREKYGEDG